MIDMRTVSTVAAALLMVAPALAAGADADGDGRITRAELAAVHATLFDAFDANKDGVVAVGEADAHFLDIADFDRDGKVTPEENNTYAAEAAARDLANCDANNDEVLAGEEVNCISSADSAE
jgi:Ca2+-binding EF-hand superfamily protein